MGKWVRPHIAVRRFTRRHHRKAQRKAGLPRAALSPGAAPMRAAWRGFWAARSGPHELWNLAALCVPCHCAVHRGEILPELRDPRSA